MSARRDGQQNADVVAAVSVTKIVTETESETESMLKIMTATPASATTTATTTSASTALTTVNAQNKCATAAPTTFSYQRAAKRCARLEQTTAAELAAASAIEKEPEEALAKESAATTTACVIPCERQLRLAEHKAQLRAAFFQDFNAIAAQQQQQQQQHPVRERESEKAFDSRTRIRQLIEKFQAMIVQQPAAEQAQLKPAVIVGSAANSDEGCNAGGLSPCSSDNECDAVARRKPKVTRCASSDSALGLDVDDVNMETLPTPQRRMTLTVTDLPLRPALLPLAEPTALPDSPLTSPTSATAALGLGVGVGVGAGVPTKVLLEERVVAALAAPPGSRRESTQSCVSELGSMAGVRYVRTPSVVVSDYSDDITACGISMEEMEYFRLQRARCQRRCSLEASAAAAGSIGGAKDEAQSDVSAASSCSNLYYCGSTISALDGGECIVNGIRVALARKSSHSSSGELSGGDDEDIDEQLQLEQQQQQRQLERERERQLSELLAATQLSDGTKKVGSSKQRCSNDGDDGSDGSVTIMGNLN